MIFSYTLFQIFEFEKELKDPSDEIVKLLVNRFFGKPLTASKMVTFKEYTKKAFSNSINEFINFRLKNALNINETIQAKSNEELLPINENTETP